MYMALADDFKARFPEFDATEVDAIVPTLEPVWPCYFGGDYTIACDKEAILNLVAHLFVDETNDGTGNLKSTKSESVGNVSVSYSAGTQDKTEWDNYLSTTKYGKRFMVLTRNNVGGYFV